MLFFRGAMLKLTHHRQLKHLTVTFQNTPEQLIRCHYKNANLTP